MDDKVTAEVVKMLKAQETEKLVPAPILLLDNGKGGTLELIQWHEEPAVIIDGRYIVRRTQLVQQIARADRKES